MNKVPSMNGNYPHLSFVLQKNLSIKPSRIPSTNVVEKTMLILDNINVEYIQDFHSENLRYAYQLYLPKYNIFIELDEMRGSYYNVVENIQLIKNKIFDALLNGYRIARIDRNEFHNLPKHVNNIVNNSKYLYLSSNVYMSM